MTGSPEILVSRGSVPGSWDARAWLEDVREAVRLLAVEDRARELRRERCYSLSDPLGHEGPGAGVTDPMGHVDVAVDAEAGYGERVDALWQEVADCRAVVSMLHRAVMDECAYVVDFRVLHRMGWGGVAKSAVMSEKTARRRYDEAADWIQEVGLPHAKNGWELPKVDQP